MEKKSLLFYSMTRICLPRIERDYFRRPGKPRCLLHPEVALQSLELPPPGVPGLRVAPRDARQLGHRGRRRRGQRGRGRSGGGRLQQAARGRGGGAQLGEVRHGRRGGEVGPRLGGVGGGLEAGRVLPWARERVWAGIWALRLWQDGRSGGGGLATWIDVDGEDPLLGTLVGDGLGADAILGSFTLPYFTPLRPLTAADATTTFLNLSSYSSRSPLLQFLLLLLLLLLPE